MAEQTRLRIQQVIRFNRLIHLAYVAAKQSSIVEVFRVLEDMSRKTLGVVGLDPGTELHAPMFVPVLTG